MIEALGLTRAYDGLRAVDDLTLEVPKGSVFGFLGRNGAGKTTTVKMLSTVLYPTAGTAAVAGFDIRNEALKVRSIIGVIGEGTELARPFWTPMEYLRFFSRLQSGSTGALGEELKEWLARLDLADHANRPIGGFSAGMRKRLELCRVFLRHPEVLLLDEPTKELDIPGKREIWELLRDLATKEKVTFSSAATTPRRSRPCATGLRSCAAASSPSPGRRPRSLAAYSGSRRDRRKRSKNTSRSIFRSPRPRQSAIGSTSPCGKVALRRSLHPSSNRRARRSEGCPRSMPSMRGSSRSCKFRDSGPLCNPR